MSPPPHLSLDIQAEIIKRLPVKSLIQFRSVCKAWKSLIDSSQFIAGYNFRHDQSEHLLVRYEVGDGEESEVKYVSFVDNDSFPQQKFDLTVPPLVQATIVIGSSHGLLCLIGYLRDPHGSCPTSETDIVVLWNPAIRKSIAIVVPNEVQPPFNYVIGFGVCPDTKDSKIVKLQPWKMESISYNPCQVMVFTLSSGEWTTSCSNHLPRRKSIEFSCSHVVIGQFIYWVAYELIAMDGGLHKLIMSFDLSTEKFREVEIPDSLRRSDLSVSRLRESLVLFEYNINATIKQVCNVWMMEDGDRKAFTKQFTIKASDASVSSTLGFRKNGEPIIEMQYDDDDDEDEDEDEQCALVVYEPFLEHIKDLGICGNKYSFFGGSYTESLLLLDHEDGHIVKCGAVKR